MVHKDVKKVEGKTVTASLPIAAVVPVAAVVTVTPKPHAQDAVQK